MYYLLRFLRVVALIEIIVGYMKYRYILKGFKNKIIGLVLFNIFNFLITKNI